MSIARESFRKTLATLRTRKLLPSLMYRREVLLAVATGAKPKVARLCCTWVWLLLRMDQSVVDEVELAREAALTDIALEAADALIDNRHGVSSQSEGSRDDAVLFRAGRNVVIASITSCTSGGELQSHEYYEMKSQGEKKGMLRLQWHLPRTGTFFYTGTLCSTSSTSPSSSERSPRLAQR